MERPNVAAHRNLAPVGRRIPAGPDTPVGPVGMEGLLAVIMGLPRPSSKPYRRDRDDPDRLPCAPPCSSGPWGPPFRVALLLICSACIGHARQESPEAPPREVGRPVAASPGRSQEEAPAKRPEGGEGGEEEWQEEWDEEEWDEEEEEPGRSFLYGELVLSGFYAPEGVERLPPDDRKRDFVEFSPRPPGNYAAVDYVGTFTSSSYVNRKILPGWMPLTAVNLHPRIVFDRTEESSSPKQVKLVPQDFWVRFHPWNVDRLSLRIGQFVIPYGADPILSPRQRFILPIEATDLGLKWDWGVGVRGPIGAYDWDVAATLGTGEALHTTHLFAGPGHTSYLLTGRVGSPTYWDFHNGLSFLFGEIPVIMGPRISDNPTMSRWRVGWDSTYKYGTYLMVGGQLTFGQDGFGGDARFVPLSEDAIANVLGYRLWADWVVPWHQDLRLAAQFESVIRNLSRSDADSTAAIFEADYSLTTSITVRLDYRVEVSRPIGDRYDAIFLTLVIYGG